MSRLDYIKEQIKQQVTIMQVVERYTDRRVVKGMCNCPLHTEKTASFTVDEQKGLYYCFGCGAGGDIFKFVQQYLNVSFTEAVNIIDRDFALGITEEKISVKAQIAVREAKKKRAIEEYTKEQDNLLYHELCEQYRLVDSLVRILQPFTDIWDKMITRRAWLECELDRLL
ncbi:MAG: CHC2 zinc finger domain-containing protein [Cellulosilyticaceae bacterium]